MNYFDLYSSYPDQTIAAAWKPQCNEANKTSSFADTLKDCVSDLYARFAARYAELHALPRSARRALPASTCTFQRTGRDLAGILTAGRTTTTASDGLVRWPVAAALLGFPSLG